MKNILKHIVIAAVIIISAACSREEFTPIHKGQNVEFILRQTGFNGFDVAASETKALTNDQLTELETRIHSLYFLVFDASGNRREFKSLATDITSQTLYHNYSNGPLTVCYLANVPQAYAESIDHTDDFADVPLDGISYTYDKTSNGDFVVIPQIGGVQCIPMFGKVAYPGAAVGESVVQIHLERLFAKVVVSLKADLSDDSWGIDFNPPSIELESFSVVNLPEKVALQEAFATDGTIIRESGWARASDAFADPLGTVFEPKLTVSDDGINLGGVSLSGFTKVISCYIPEYALTPSASNTANDQKLKPTFCPSDKHPVFLTFKGVAKQDKMVDVPLEYFIHFGENPYDSFSLHRNTQYDNNLTIKGTLDAVLENDKRVDATYHNLADPLNTGSDNPANCYIISKPGRYLIPTYVGNDVNQLLSGRSAEVLTLNGSTNNRIDNVECVTIDGKNFIQFDVNMFDAAGNTTLTDVAGGNKLLVLKNANGQIIWSWHLWLCEENSRPDKSDSSQLDRYPDNSGNWNGYYVMNRALGATTSIDINLSSIGFNQGFLYSDGLYYQWGRKDPMNGIQSPQTGGTYSNSVLHPTVFYSDWNASGAGWSDTKSVNDPCPPGYKVPSKTVWRTTNSDAAGFEVAGVTIPTTTTTAYTFNLTQADNAASNYIFYPYSGRIDDTGSLKITDNGNIQYPYGDQVFECGLQVLTFNLVSARVKNLVIEINQDGHYGMLWGTDKNSLQYSFRSVDMSDIASIRDKITIKSCSIQRNNYEITYRTVFGIQIPTGTKDHWEAYYTHDLSGNALTDTEKAFILARLVFGQSNLSDYGYEIKASPTSHGAHVRCVRE